jgi:hypothetical protein
VAALGVGHNMRTIAKWGLLIFSALLIASIPTRLGSHDVAVGIPFTWHTSQQIVTFGPQPESFSFLLLFSDFALALLLLAGLLRFFRARRT